MRVILPKYSKIDAAGYSLRPLGREFKILLGGRNEPARIFESTMDNGVPVYFVDSDKYFARPGIYGTPDGDYNDNKERFVFFSKAVLEAAKLINFQPDVIHCHDWQTGIVPALLKTAYSFDAFFLKTASVFTIHNIAYQGLFTQDILKIAGIPQTEFTWDKLEYFGKVNLLKSGIVYSEAISTVSPTYAKEILLTEEGRGMEPTLRYRSGDLFGILNGLDYQEWNPAEDQHIKAVYDSSSMDGKQLCRLELQKTAGLQADRNAFVLGMVSRVDPQKGCDLLADSIAELLKNNIQVVVLGSGDRKLQEQLALSMAKFPGRASFNPGFNNPLAHKIYAGSDSFLMPSRFEPCGLGQMIALAYGTIPIVHKTGGLADTIADYNAKTGEGNGISFRPLTTEAFVKAVLKAYGFFKNRKQWNKLVSNAMKSDFSWSKTVGQYVKLYTHAVKQKNEK